MFDNAQRSALYVKSFLAQFLDGSDLPEAGFAAAW